MALLLQIDDEVLPQQTPELVLRRSGREVSSLVTCLVALCTCTLNAQVGQEGRGETHQMQVYNGRSIRAILIVAEPQPRVEAFESGWFWGFCSALRSRRDQWPRSDPAMCRANFSSRPMPGRCPLWDRRQDSGRWPVLDVVLARSSWWTPVGRLAYCQMAICSRCHGTFRAVGEAPEAASGVRTVHGSLALRRAAAAGRGTEA